MDVSVVVVTYSHHDLLRQCLQSVLAAMQAVDGEVIVVDNASTDATIEVLAQEFPQVRVIQNSVNLYYTRAVNQGMRAASGKYVFLLNDDTQMEVDCLEKLVRFMEEHPRCGVVGPKLLSPQREVQPSAQRFPQAWREALALIGISWYLRRWSWAQWMQKMYPTPMATQQVDWVCGGAIFLRRLVMADLGYHDENYLFYRDDPDIGMRMKAVGRQVWYCADTYLLHYHGMSTVKTPNKIRFKLIDVRSRRHYHRKFHGWLGMSLVEVSDAVSTLLRVLKAMALLRFDSARQRWEHLRVLVEACRMPKEERCAIEGYRVATYNGMEPGT